MARVPVESIARCISACAGTLERQVQNAIGTSAAAQARTGRERIRHDAKLIDARAASNSTALNLDGKRQSRLVAIWRARVNIAPSIAVARPREYVITNTGVERSCGHYSVGARPLTVDNHTLVNLGGFQLMITAI